MIRGPANRPAFVVAVVVALTVAVLLVLTGRWLLLVIVVGATLLGELWRQFGPQRRAGRVRRKWPWHDD